MSTDYAGARLVLYSRDSDLNRSRRLVPLHAPHGGPAIRSSCGHLRAQTGAEDSGCSFVGQAEAHGCVLHRFSGFVEIPVRWIDFDNRLDTRVDLGNNPAGLSDVNFGAKYAVVAEHDQYLTLQLRTFAPSGDSHRGLGTDHWSLEPAVLFYQKLFELDPKLKTLFKNDMTEQQRKLMTMLDTAVRGLKNPDSINTAIARTAGHLNLLKPRFAEDSLTEAFKALWWEGS